MSLFEFPNDDILESDVGMFTNLHAHSIFSPLDGFAKLDDYIQRAKKLGMKGVTFTDHGNMFGAYDLWKTCEKHGMKPIFGNETYIAPHSGLVKEKTEGYKPAYHCLLMAASDVGYQNLMKITSDSWTKYKYYKARTDFSHLQEYKEGIICTSACLGGMINQFFLENKKDEAIDVANKFKRIFGDNFYLEMTYTGMEEQDLANNFLRELSVRCDIPMVITCDSHYTYKHEWEYHAALVSINTGSSFKKKKEKDSGELTDNNKDTDESSMFYTPGEYYLKPYHVLREYFNKPGDDEAFANTNKIAEQCNVNFKTGATIYPNLVKDADGFLRESSTRYLMDYVKKNNFDQAKIDNYINRLNYELDIISKMQFSGYFIVVADYVQHAKKNGILVGPARGSGAGSMVAFCTEITTVDPIKFGLLFERMLNRGRAKLPLIELPGHPLKDYL